MTDYVDDLNNLKLMMIMIKVRSFLWNLYMILIRFLKILIDKYYKKMDENLLMKILKSKKK